MKFTKFFYYSSLVGAVLCFVFAFFTFLGFSMNSSVDTFATVFRLLIVGVGTLLAAFFFKEILSLEEQISSLHKTCNKNISDDGKENTNSSQKNEVFTLQTENQSLAQEVESLKTQLLQEREIDDTQRLYEARIRNLKKDEKTLRKQGKIEEASALRKEWRILAQEYQIYSIDHDRAYYPYRCALEKEEADSTE